MTEFKLLISIVTLCFLYAFYVVFMTIPQIRKEVDKIEAEEKRCAADERTECEKSCSPDL